MRVSRLGPASSSMFVPSKSNTNRRQVTRKNMRCKIRTRPSKSAPFTKLISVLMLISLKTRSVSEAFTTSSSSITFQRFHPFPSTSSFKVSAGFSKIEGASTSQLFSTPTATKSTATDSTYGAGQITVLEGLEPVRKRPGM